MRKSMVLFLLLGMCLSVSAGCGESADSDASEGTTITADSWSANYSAAICKQAFSCCSSDEILPAFGRLLLDFESEAQCVGTYGLYKRGKNKAKIASVKAGRIIFHANKATECLDAIRSRTCAEPIIPEDDAIDACTLIFEANVDEGGACGTSEDCRQGFCEGLEFGNDELLGTCTRLGETGDSCHESVECAQGYHCYGRWDVELSETVATCQKTAELGDECMTYCGEGAYCEYDPQQDKRFCVPLKAEGETCALDECNGETYCAGEANLGNGICTASTRDDWEPCEHSGECKSGYCNIFRDPEQSVCIPQNTSFVCTGA